jgi:rSAM/selenodomain-associated transferase 1
MSRWAILFAKKPEEGSVKTRLQPEFSPVESVELYTNFAKDCIENLARASIDRRLIAYTPSDAEETLRGLNNSLTSFEYYSQGSGNLGLRLERVFNFVFSKGGERVVALGTDAPTLPTDYINLAFDLLGSNDVVLGPAVDGGYYLIGSRVDVGNLFRDIPWGTEHVFEQTIDRLKGTSFSLLPPWYDIDRPRDVKFLIAHLRGMHLTGSPVARNTLSYLEQSRID